MLLPKTLSNWRFPNGTLQIAGRGGRWSEKLKLVSVYCANAPAFGNANIWRKREVYIRLKDFLKINGSKRPFLLSSCLVPSLPTSLSLPPPYSLFLGSDVLLLSTREILDLWRKRWKSNIPNHEEKENRRCIHGSCWIKSARSFSCFGVNLGSFSSSTAHQYSFKVGPSLEFEGTHNTGPRNYRMDLPLWENNPK